MWPCTYLIHNNIIYLQLITFTPSPLIFGLWSSSIFTWRSLISCSRFLFRRSYSKSRAASTPGTDGWTDSLNLSFHSFSRSHFKSAIRGINLLSLLGPGIGADTSPLGRIWAYRYPPRCVPWQCTAIAVQQYTEQYTFFFVCAHFHSGYVPI